MKILLVNKYLFPKGGAESYVLRLGQSLEVQGQEVQYFGMDHPQRCVGNRLGLYTREMEFHQRSVARKLCYLPHLIYSTEAHRKITAVLEEFQPDVVHFNNIHFQLTPSILAAAAAYRRRRNPNLRLIVTAHDYQLVCPNHMLYRPQAGETCQRCLGGHFGACLRGRCIHQSLPRSAIGMLEAQYWNRRNIYQELDAIVCPSRFLQAQLDHNPVLAAKTVFLSNFAPQRPTSYSEDLGRYVLYFGRYSEEKGLRTLLQACRALPSIPFVFAGSGPMGAELAGLPNVRDVGFQSGEALTRWIQGARFSVYPSEWYENCPLSVIESQICGTPVLASRMGGIPELIQEGETGCLFEAGNVAELTAAIQRLWRDRAWIARSREACRQAVFLSREAYVDQLMDLYRAGKEGER